MAEEPKAVCLLSGGIDSSTCLAIARSQGYRCYALTIDYGQRHRVELEAACRVAAALGATDHLIVRVDLAAIGGSALTGSLQVPKDQPLHLIGQRIPPTYVPARNTVFLALALAWAEVLGATDIFIGANAVDYSGYPDCRPEYLAAFEQLANLATRAGVEEGKRFRVHAPLLRMSKGEIIRRALELGVDLSLTHTCYDPGPKGEPCGGCDACLLRRKGFLEAGVPDPLDQPR